MNYLSILFIAEIKNACRFNYPLEIWVAVMAIAENVDVIYSRDSRIIHNREKQKEKIASVLLGAIDCWFKYNDLLLRFIGNDYNSERDTDLMISKNIIIDVRT